jgi:hypothetical protein
MLRRCGRTGCDRTKFYFSTMKPFAPWRRNAYSQIFRLGRSWSNVHPLRFRRARFWMKLLCSMFPTCSTPYGLMHYDAMQSCQVFPHAVNLQVYAMIAAWTSFVAAKCSVSVSSFRPSSLVRRHHMIETFRRSPQPQLRLRR